MMPTKKLYDADGQMRSFSATVLSCRKHVNGYEVVLDQTAFFPESGGQPSDRGTLGDARVTDVQILDDVIFHYTDAPLEESAVVQGILDWERRFDLMQQHTGEHILSGVAHRLYGVQNVGFHLGEEVTTFDFDRFLTDDQLLALETKANQIIWNGAKVRCYYPSPAKLQTTVYRGEKERDGAVRLVEIEGADCCACCAPHVKDASEVGMVKLLEHEKLRGGIRIYLKCGNRALSDYREKCRQIFSIGEMLSAKPHETADAVRRLAEQSVAEKQQTAEMQKKWLAEKIKNCTDTVVFDADCKKQDLQSFADGLYRAKAGPAVVFCPAENGFGFVLCGEPAEIEQLYTAFSAEFCVRGGGRNGMKQGVVLEENEANLRRFFAEKIRQ